jgi:hypothetical protein
MDENSVSHATTPEASSALVVALFGLPRRFLARDDTFRGRRSIRAVSETATQWDLQHLAVRSMKWLAI